MSAENCAHRELVCEPICLMAFKEHLPFPYHTLRVIFVSFQSPHDV
jgi:hypothetical protein